MEKETSSTEDRYKNKPAILILVMAAVLFIAGLFVFENIEGQEQDVIYDTSADIPSLPEPSEEYQFEPDLDTSDWDDYYNASLGLGFKVFKPSIVYPGEFFAQLGVHTEEDDFGNPVVEEYYSLDFKFRPEVYEDMIKDSRWRLGRDGEIRVSKVVIGGKEGTAVEKLHGHSGSYYREFYIPFQGMTLFIYTSGEKQKVDNLIKTIYFTEPEQYIIRYTWLKYENADLGLALSYPPDWSIDESENRFRLYNQDKNWDVSVEVTEDLNRVEVLSSGKWPNYDGYSGTVWKKYFFENQNPGEEDDHRSTRVYVSQRGDRYYIMKTTPAFDYSLDAVEETNYFQILFTLRWLDEEG